MKTGAVAMIDALGFRGIWGRCPPEVVIANMSSLKLQLERDLKELSAQPIMQFDATFLSDTIVVGLSLPETVGSNRDALSVTFVTDILARILAWSARSTTPLAYRGVVAYGEYEIQPHFIVGKAIDEAASYYELAQAAVVWLLPQTRDIVAQQLRWQPRNTHLVRFEVPLKAGDAFESYTVSPIVQAKDIQDAETLTGALLNTFEPPSVDIAVKKQNTIKHLRACYKWRGWRFPKNLLPLEDNR
jgi:hypothetical protein